MAARRSPIAPKPTPAIERWFWVCAVYKSTQSSASMQDSHQHLFERRVFVIRAVRGQERKVARRVAKSRETKIRDAAGVTVTWQLQEIEGYAELFDKRITSGAEVYWSYFIRVDAARKPAARKPAPADKAPRKKTANT